MKTGFLSLFSLINTAQFIHSSQALSSTFNQISHKRKMQCDARRLKCRKLQWRWAQRAKNALATRSEQSIAVISIAKFVSQGQKWWIFLCVLSKAERCHAAVSDGADGSSGRMKRLWVWEMTLYSVARSVECSLFMWSQKWQGCRDAPILSLYLLKCFDMQHICNTCLGDTWQMKTIWL